MKDVLKMIAFIIYTVLLFWVENSMLLLCAILFQIACMLICNISIRQALKAILYLMPFILFTFIINLFVMEKRYAILIGIRLIIICNMTYIYGKTTTAREISKSIEKILTPLTWFKVNTRNIGIIISIAITLIPMINREIENIRYSLIAKGFNMSLFNQIRHINYIMLPLFYGLLKRVNSMEEALLAKGYMA